MIVLRLETGWVTLEEFAEDNQLDPWVAGVQEDYRSVAQLVGDLDGLYAQITFRDTVTGEDQEWIVAPEQGRLRWERKR